MSTDVFLVNHVDLAPDLLDASLRVTDELGYRACGLGIHHLLVAGLEPADQTMVIKIVIADEADTADAGGQVHRPARLAPGFHLPAKRVAF